MQNEKKTANYSVIPTESGNRYTFLCDISGAVVCTTEAVIAKTPEDELMFAWNNEGKNHFNRCHKCGRWVIDAMYNADVLECVDCAPYETDPKYCKSCGTKVTGSSKRCSVCGNPLVYDGSEL